MLGQSGRLRKYETQVSCNCSSSAYHFSRLMQRYITVRAFLCLIFPSLSNYSVKRSFVEMYFARPLPLSGQSILFPAELEIGFYRTSFCSLFKEYCLRNVDWTNPYNYLNFMPSNSLEHPVSLCIRERAINRSAKPFIIVYPVQHSSGFFNARYNMGRANLSFALASLHMFYFSVVGPGALFMRTDKSIQKIL